LCSTFHSTVKMNAVFQKQLAAMPAATRDKILEFEKTGLFGKGKDFEKNRYPSDYMTAAWGEGYFPYLYGKHPDPNFDPVAMGNTAWDLYREMWGSHGEFIIDGNLKSVEYAERLKTLRVPTLMVVGDHDECDPSLSREMNTLIPGSKLAVMPQSGHMTFVDQPGLFLRTVDEFLHRTGGGR
jgi:pimeloyl-ACP methyl ester carboxylesterase